MTEVFKFEMVKFLITFFSCGYEELNTSFYENGGPNLGNVYLLCIYVKPFIKKVLILFSFGLSSARSIGGQTSNHFYIYTHSKGH